MVEFFFFPECFSSYEMLFSSTINRTIPSGIPIVSKFCFCFLTMQLATWPLDVTLVLKKTTIENKPFIGNSI